MLGKGATLVLAAAVATPSLAQVKAADGPASSQEEKRACAEASERAQELRSVGKLLAARERLLVCARSSCPGVVRKDCSDWLSEVERVTPSLVPTARDAAGHDVTSARVIVDGVTLTSGLDGRAIPVDPGRHTLRVEAASGTAQSELLVREGERGRVVSMVLEGSTPVPGPAAATAPVPTLPISSGHEAPRRRGPPVVAYGLGGLGIVALGSFAFFGLTGQGDVDHLRTTCAPGCAQDDVDAAKTKLMVADVSLAVGALALGTAAVLFAWPRAEF